MYPTRETMAQTNPQDFVANNKKSSLSYLFTYFVS